MSVVYTFVIEEILRQIDFCCTTKGIVKDNRTVIS